MMVSNYIFLGVATIMIITVGYILYLDYKDGE